MVRLFPIVKLAIESVRRTKKTKGQPLGLALSIWESVECLRFPALTAYVALPVTDGRHQYACSRP
jgi:hypothetical protein